MCAELSLPLGLECISESLHNLIQKLKFKDRFQSSQEVAIETLLLLRQLVSRTKWNTTLELIERIKELGRILTNIQPSESHTGNMVRRVLYLVREEYVRMSEGFNNNNNNNDNNNNNIIKDEQPLGARVKTSASGIEIDYSMFIQSGTVIGHIKELIDEVEDSTNNIAQQAFEHIHSNEVIMTVGYSKTVFAFLTFASKMRKFKVMVAECAPTCQGQDMVSKLASSDIETTLITDSAIFAIMSRVNKVIIGTHTVMADGGLKALNGAHNLALAAKFHSVPVVVCAAGYKLSPEYPCYYQHDSFNKCASPMGILTVNDFPTVNGIHVQNPVFDYVPPDLIQVYINQKEGFAPFYVYRYLQELYHPDDYAL